MTTPDESQRLLLGTALSLDGLGDEPVQPVHLDATTLLRHTMALGSSGSGKTVFCKGLVEEVVRLGVPAICVDPQGDLASLALAADDPKLLARHGVDPELAREFREKVDVVVFTPASPKGVGLCADPLRIDTHGLSEREKAQATSAMASMLVGLLGYDLSRDDGEGLVAVFDQALGHFRAQTNDVMTLEAFSGWFQGLDDEARTVYERYVSPKVVEQALRRLARLDVGVRRHLFHDGIALDIDLLLGRGPAADVPPGRTRLSVIYLNTLQAQDDKVFLLAALCEQLYTWMLSHPSASPQALFYIDEVAPFVPPVQKPACKPALALLLKQARKYGVCCLMATQNPGDVDYKALAQFGTWSIGRLTTRQDLRKIEPTVKSIDPERADQIMAALPSLGPGQFLILSPDNFDRTRPIQARWLYSEHSTLDEEAIEALADARWRDRFSGAMGADVGRRSTTPTSETESPSSTNTSGGAVREPTVPGVVVSEPTASDLSLSEPIPTEPAAPRPASSLAPQTPDEGPPLVDVTLAAGDDDFNGVTEAKPRRRTRLEGERTLEELVTASVREFAEASSVSESAARRTLRKLEEDGVARSYREGRTHRYFATSSGLRPELGLVTHVRAFVPRISEGRAEIIASEEAARPLLGLFGDEEVLSGLQLEHRLVMRVSFRERVLRPLWRRLFGPTHDEREDSVYFHPRSLGFVSYSQEGGVQVRRPEAEYASEIGDFDGKVELEDVLPGALVFDDQEWSERPADNAIEQHFQKYFTVAPLGVEPIFIPVWRMRFARRGQGGERLVTIDALSGRLLEW